MGLEQAWYRNSRWLKLLRPLETLFCAIARRRRKAFQKGRRASWTAPVPVVVVGNISVGGTGKSPLVLFLIEQLRQRGYKPGVISRGYRAAPPTTPYFVTAASTSVEAGDEPLMIVRRTGVPLVISPDRVAAAKLLLEQTACDLIISDDGLQHYALNRSVEIAVIDGVRGFGNGRCLPEGPLREPVARLDEVDLIVVNGASPEQWLQNSYLEKSFTMTLQPGELVRLGDDKHVAADEWSESRQVNAVAAIGNPKRFSATLEALDFSVTFNSFPDHHAYVEKDFNFQQDGPLIMTEKDAVKCDHIALHNTWYLQVNAVLEQGFAIQLEALLNDLAPSVNATE
ncbi:tetraacyldisaccharide 4'-kinase [Amphritea japonica]|uniref:Tetraacyldisaccharide 4'-kinase n=1 Tax=Amphritea japonica ATCC BAA-1530 TaxID=1278309 RepID=A0A7R6PGK7_9GAMM|nr:tetraacyldisaccharide 4'-kinase [Amphritea japonica]BBB26097.1 tetraacyldisaccharide 4'-kinase [Amphritea japonica ATCC BAA-1530]